MLSIQLRNQHDHLGNAPHLLSASDLDNLERGNYYRTSIECVCDQCGKKYGTHPVVIGAIWLNRLCNGNLVKF